MVSAHHPVFCELWSKRVMYLCLVTVCAVWDVGRARAACAHQVLCETGKNGVETFEMLKTAFGEQCLSPARIFEWHKRFKEGRDSADGNPRSGRPTTSKTDDFVA